MCNMQPLCMMRRTLGTGRTIFEIRVNHLHFVYSSRPNALAQIYSAKNDWMHGCCCCCFCLLLEKLGERDIYPRYAIYRQWIRKMLIAPFIRERLSFHSLFIIQVFRWNKRWKKARKNERKKNYIHNCNSVNFLTMQKMASGANWEQKSGHEFHLLEY